jgi:hypothetical protein
MTIAAFSRESSVLFQAPPVGRAAAHGEIIALFVDGGDDQSGILP